MSNWIKNGFENVLSTTIDETTINGSWGLSASSKILSYIIYFDNNYLVIDDEGISCYKITNKGDNLFIVIGEEHIEIIGKEIEISDLPDYIKGRVIKEMV